MRTIIAGGRDYQFTLPDIQWLDGLKESLPITEVVCGMAQGADRCGMVWAHSRDLPVRKFPADWKRHGKQAGYLRNEEMAKNADLVILFPGGRGTQMMREIAMRKELPVYERPTAGGK